MKIHGLLSFLLLTAATAFAQDQQWVEGFDKVEFCQSTNNSGRDFRGVKRGYMTASWWTTQIKTNHVSWWTAAAPKKEPTTFSFIGASSVLPAEFSRGPKAKLTVNGQYALTFSIGFTRDMTWKEGAYELKYISKRVEYPFGGSHRQFDLHGESGIYQLSVPSSAIAAGKPILLDVELLPFAGWSHGWFMVKERRDTMHDSMESLAGEIRSLREDLNAANEQTQILAAKAYPELLDKHQFQHQVIYANGFRHVHPADLIKLQNGELLVTFREGTEHISNDGDVVMLRSRDGGKNWGDRQVIAALKDVDEREGCGIQLRNGTILVAIFYNNLYDVNGVYRGPTKPPNHINALGTYVITSKDNGYTWTEPSYVDTKGMPFTNIEGPTDAPIEMPDGSILMAVIGYGIDGDSKNVASVMLRSTDQGKSWKYISTIASDPGGKLGSFLEPGIVRTKSGRIVAGLRNHGNDHAIYTTYSDDDGKTWAPVQKTAMIGHPVDLIQLVDGRIMATYSIRPGRHTTPGGIRACFSNDNGATWDVSTEVSLRSDFLNWDIGYPESMEMPDGKVLTVYYYNLFGKYFIGATSWKP